MLYWTDPSHYNITFEDTIIMQAHLTKISSNRKTGPIPVTTTSKGSCPPSCPLKNAGCYAEDFHLNMHWQAVTDEKRGSSWDQFCSDIAKLPRGQLWRHNQAGDLVGRNNVIDSEALNKLTKANKGKRGFTYTHYPLLNNEANKASVINAIENGFIVNASANNDNEAMALFKAGLPVVTIATQNKPYKLANGVQVAICPAQKSEGMTCAKCQLCAVKERNYVIGFIPHGTKAKKVIAITAIH